MVHFYHFKDILSQELIDKIKLPFSFNLIHWSNKDYYDDDNPEKKKGDWLGRFDIFEGEYVCQEQAYSVRAPYDGTYVELLYVWRRSAENDRQSRFSPDIIDLNPIFLISAENRVEYMLAMAAYNECCHKSNPLFISDDNLNMFLLNDQWMEQKRIEIESAISKEKNN